MMIKYFILKFSKIVIMEIQELRNLYLNKIIKHINKVNNELTIYNQSNVQSGGMNLAPFIPNRHTRNNDHIDNAAASINRLRDEISRLKSLQTDHDSKNIEIERLKNHIKEIQEEKKQLQKNIETLTINKQKLENQLLISTDYKKQLEASLVDLNAQLITSIQKIDELNIKLVQLEDKLRNLQTENKTLKSEIQKLKLINEEKNNKNDELITQVRELTSNIITIGNASKDKLVDYYVYSIEIIKNHINQTLIEINRLKKTIEISKNQLKKDGASSEITMDGIELNDEYDNVDLNTIFDTEEEKQKYKIIYINDINDFINNITINDIDSYYQNELTKIKQYMEQVNTYENQVHDRYRQLVDVTGNT